MLDLGRGLKAGGERESIPPQGWSPREGCTGCSGHSNRTPQWGRRTSSYIVVSVILLFTPLSHTLVCDICDLSKCSDPVPKDCPGSLTTDPCGCCHMCARVVNQTCGGQYGIHGTCDIGLVCSINPQPGGLITGQEIGICITPGRIAILKVKIITYLEDYPNCRDYIKC